jgi:hypothetical protein
MDYHLVSLFTCLTLLASVRHHLHAFVVVVVVVVVV